MIWCTQMIFNDAIVMCTCLDCLVDSNVSLDSQVTVLHV